MLGRETATSDHGAIASISNYPVVYLSLAPVAVDFLITAESEIGDTGLYRPGFACSERVSRQRQSNGHPFEVRP